MDIHATAIQVRPRRVDAKLEHRSEGNLNKHTSEADFVELVEHPTDAAIVEVFWFHPWANQVFGGFALEKLAKQVQRCRQEA
jgi:hypothetical protein